MDDSDSNRLSFSWESKAIAVLALLGISSALLLPRESSPAQLNVKLEESPAALTWGEDGHFVFSVSNPNAREILIHRIRTSCGCSRPLLQKMNLAPGESMPLRLVVSAGSRDRPVELNAIIYYSCLGERKQHIHRVTYRVDIVPEFTWSPSELEFVIPTTMSSGPLSASVTFTGDVELGGVDVSHESLTASLVEDPSLATHGTSRRDRNAVTTGPSCVRVAFDPSLWPESREREGFIEVHTRSQHKPLVRVIVHIERGHRSNEDR